MTALSVSVEDFVVGFHEGFVRSRVTSKKFMTFLFASMVILRPFDFFTDFLFCFLDVLVNIIFL